MSKNILEDKLARVRPYMEWAEQTLNTQGTNEKPEALDDLVVLDLSYGHLGGMVASSFLAEFGAEVIKIEPPEGDPARFFSPFGHLHNGSGLGYLVEGRDKFFITLDLRKPEGRRILKKFVLHSDVLIETYKPGVMDALGIGYKQLSKINPALIYAAFSLYGQFGPKAERYSNMPDSDIAEQALSTIVYSSGDKKPLKMGNWMGFYVGGAAGAIGILASLFYRDISGKGQFIDVAGAEALRWTHDSALVWYDYARKIKRRYGFLDLNASVYSYFQAKDGWVCIAEFTDNRFILLCNTIGRPDLAKNPRFKSSYVRSDIENQRILYKEISKWTKERTRQEIYDILINAGLVVGGVRRADEIVKDKHSKICGIFRSLQDPIYGELLLQNSTPPMSGSPPRIKKWACRPIGYDNQYIYMKHLGYGKCKLEELKRKKLI
jgi:crotonobetainyl-CoA:carnitine CoA-transferase CaiB-like acyl-CoA transferase